MAVQEVVRDWIFHYDAEYLSHYEHRLTVKDTKCKSCGNSFNDNWVYSKYEPRGIIKRHLTCAIAHNVITIKEAKQLGDKKDLQIDWPFIQKQADEYLERRSMHTMALYSWVMGVIAFIGLVPVVPI